MTMQRYRATLAHYLSSSVVALMGLLGAVVPADANTDTHGAPQSIVFYYGDEPNMASLRQFDLAVIDPDTPIDATDLQDDQHRWFAYVSVGEVANTRDYYALIPDAWLIGHNEAWASEIIDQTAAGWPEFFAEHIVAPLWNQGFRGFFLDTLDSYLIVARDESAQRDSQEGLIQLIRTLRHRFPGIRLILNRGFELLPDVHQDIFALAFESLFRGWDEARNSYVDVPETDRQWLLEQTRQAREHHRLPIIAIDYCHPEHERCAQNTVQKIREHGLIPYVGDGRLQSINFASLP